MSDRAAASPIYSIDTSSLMDWQARFYPTDIFPGLITSVEALAKAGLHQDAVFLICGGPPCQSFSTAGRRQSTRLPRRRGSSRA